MFEWKHIMDVRPTVGRWIIEMYPPSYDKCWSIIMRKYVEFCTFEINLEHRRRAEHDDPNHWWVYIEDFPFPPVKPVDK